jgi:uncharacterized protein YndB with AHSA1/START domain
MSRSQWHRFYTSNVAASPELLFCLLADLPDYHRWLPPSAQFASTTDVEPYPVGLGSRYRDGKPGEPGRDWQGSVTGFRPPGSIDFHQTIPVRQLRATVDVHIHYALEDDGQGTAVTRWLVLDVTMPALLRPLRSAITSRFDKENLRTMAALKQYAETHAREPRALTSPRGMEPPAVRAR